MGAGERHVTRPEQSQGQVLHRAAPLEDAPHAAGVGAGGVGPEDVGVVHGDGFGHVGGDVGGDVGGQAGPVLSHPVYLASAQLGEVDGGGIQRQAVGVIPAGDHVLDRAAGLGHPPHLAGARTPHRPVDVGSVHGQLHALGVHRQDLYRAAGLGQATDAGVVAPVDVRAVQGQSPVQDERAATGDDGGCAAGYGDALDLVIVPVGEVDVGVVGGQLVRIEGAAMIQRLHRAATQGHALEGRLAIGGAELAAHADGIEDVRAVGRHRLDVVGGQLLGHIGRRHAGGLACGGGPGQREAEQQANRRCGQPIRSSLVVHRFPPPELVVIRSVYW